MNDILDVIIDGFTKTGKQFKNWKLYISGENLVVEAQTQSGETYGNCLNILDYLKTEFEEKTSV